jgi:hypothetical protein
MRAPTYDAQEKLFFTDGDFDERYTAGELHIDTEHVFWTAITEGNPTNLRARDPEGSEKPDAYNEIWLNEHYWRHALAAAPLHKVTGRFDVSGLPPFRVGEIDAGFSLEGEDWLVRSIERNRDLGTAKIVGVRPTAEYSPGRLIGSVLGAPERVVLIGRVNTGADPEYFLEVSWGLPTGGVRPENYYWEIYDEDGSATAWGQTQGTSVSTPVTQAEFDSADYAQVRSRYTLAPEWKSDWSQSSGGGLDNGYTY